MKHAVVMLLTTLLSGLSGIAAADTQYVIQTERKGDTVQRRHRRGDARRSTSATPWKFIGQRALRPDSKLHHVTRSTLTSST